MRRAERRREVLEQRARLTRLHQAAAAASGLDPDSVRLVIPTGGTTRRVYVQRPSGGRPAPLTYSLSALQQESDLEVLGGLAHEHQHLLLGHGRSAATRASRWVLIAVVLFPVFCWLPLVGIVSAFFPDVDRWALMACLAAWPPYLYLIAKWLPRFYPHTRRSASRARVNELHCDLAAAQAVGREPVLATLFGLMEYEAEVEARMGRVQRWLMGRFHQAHPSTADRIAAVEAYDPTTDPTAAARLELAEDHAAPTS